MKKPQSFFCPETGDRLVSISKLSIEMEIPSHQQGCPYVIISEEMLTEAKSLVPKIQLHNDRANRFDSLTGTIGELAFAEWWLGDWRKHNVSRNFGGSDFPDVEVKTSCITFTETRHLVAKRSYVLNRPAAYYVQVFIHTKTPYRGPLVGDTVFLAGWCAKELLLAEFSEHSEITRDGVDTGIQTLRLPLSKLNPMSSFPLKGGVR